MGMALTARAPLVTDRAPCEWHGHGTGREGCPIPAPPTATVSSYVWGEVLATVTPMLVGKPPKAARQ
jgi:hypothetical protein